MARALWQCDVRLDRDRFGNLGQEEAGVIKLLLGQTHPRGYKQSKTAAVYSVGIMMKKLLLAAISRVSRQQSQLIMPPTMQHKAPSQQ